MKKYILLIGIYFYISGIYAQKFETYSLNEKGDLFEVRVKHFNKLFETTFMLDRIAPLIQEKEKITQRRTWREKCAKKLLINQLKRILREVAAIERGGLWVTFYIDKTGKVITVKFIVTSGVYVKLSTKIQQELYNMSMERS